MNKVKIGDNFKYAENVTGEVVEVNESGMVRLLLSTGLKMWANPDGLEHISKKEMQAEADKKAEAEAKEKAEAEAETEK